MSPFLAVSPGAEGWVDGTQHFWERCRLLLLKGGPGWITSPDVSPSRKDETGDAEAQAG